MMFPGVKHQEAIALLSISVLVMKFTDVGHTKIEEALNVAELRWKLGLVISSISPWTIIRLYRLATTTKLTKQQQADNCPQIRKKKNQKRFMIHDIIHNITGCFFHIAPWSIFAWIAVINFPLFFALFDQAMEKKKKTQPILLLKKQHIHHPFFRFGLITYLLGTILRGHHYLLSGSGIITLSFPSTRHSMEFAVFANAIPLTILFLLEHATIRYGLNSCHHAVHTLAHLALHKTINDMYEHYFL